MYKKEPDQKAEPVKGEVDDVNGNTKLPLTNKDPEIIT